MSTPREIYQYSSYDDVQGMGEYVSWKPVDKECAAFIEKTPEVVRKLECHDAFIDFAENFIIWHPESKAVIEKLKELLKKAKGE
jgi:hypothetical protein